MSEIAASPAPPRASALARWTRIVLPPFVVASLVIGLWYYLTYQVLGRDDRRLPPPHKVVQTGFLTWRNLHEILDGFYLSAKVALIGLLVAIAIGVLAGVILSQSRWIERTLFPYAVVLQTVPTIAIIPLIGIWFGYHFNSRVIVCVMISLFPIITNTLFGLKSAERAQHDLFSLHGASRSTRLRKLQFPAALPAMFTGFRISAGLSVIGAIVGEFFFRAGSEAGLGRLITLYQNRGETAKIFTCLFFSSVLGLVFFTLFGWLGSRLTASWWAPPHAQKQTGPRPA